MARVVRVGSAGHPAGRTAWQSLSTADFAVALAAPMASKSPHFALHHLPIRPRSAAKRAPAPLVPELSTDAAPNGSQDVDNLAQPGQWWLGLVVPKRHAKRSVTRNLIKRQMRAHADQHRDQLAPGQWVIRLRAPFDPRRFPSANSAPLSAVAREELARAFAGLAKK